MAALAAKATTDKMLSRLESLRTVEIREGKRENLLLSSSRHTFF